VSSFWRVGQLVSSRAYHVVDGPSFDEWTAVRRRAPAVRTTTGRWSASKLRSARRGRRRCRRSGRCCVKFSPGRRPRCVAGDLGPALRRGRRRQVEVVQVRRETGRDSRNRGVIVDDGNLYWRNIQTRTLTGVTHTAGVWSSRRPPRSSRTTNVKSPACRSRGDRGGSAPPR